ncbi:MAG: hypothetical protein CFE44_20305 [Burkholderiales bacterium PBB4]|nr:MAG: hypothetical protein CFE44_20305 [Burkholderiales bacterium PBB4]
MEAWVKEMENTNIKRDPEKKKTHRLYNGDIPRTYAASTIRKFFYTLKKVVEWHASRHRYAFNTPFKGVKLPSENNSRDRRFQENEEARLLATCEKMPNAYELKTILLFATETAMRAGEILKMTWSMVDSKGQRVVLPSSITKTSKAREVPLTSIAVKLLDDLKQKKPPQTTSVRTFVSSSLFYSTDR